MFESAMINEPSVFGLLRFACILLKKRMLDYADADLGLACSHNNDEE